MNASEGPQKASVCRKGLLRFVIGLAVFAVGLTIPLFLLPYLDHQLTPPGMIPFALPGAYALSGLVEFITGISFLEFARRWDELKGWQRGVFGTFIVLVAGFLIICGFALVLPLFF
jgi:hypothetical protein